MANVADSNSWRSPLSGSQLPGHAVQLPLAAAEPVSPDFRLMETGAKNIAQAADLAMLAMAVRHLFGSGQHRVIWNSARGRFGASIAQGHNARIDPQHDQLAPSNIDVLKPAAVGPAGVASGVPEPWLIMVVPAEDVVSNDAECLAAIQQHPGHFLLIACDEEESGVVAASDGINDSLIEASKRLQCEHQGPVAGADLRELVGALETIKQLGRPTLLHVRTRQPGAPQRFIDIPVPQRAASAAPATIERGEETLLQIAAQELVDIARVDPRVIATSTSNDPIVWSAWDEMPQRILRVDQGVPYVLQWCASLAGEGTRPFALISAEELQDGFGQLRREICLRGAPVTLVVDARSAAGPDQAATSASLAAIRQLPRLSILSPKNGRELRRMLRWSLTQAEASVLWLTKAAGPEIAWDADEAIELGKAELVRTGEQVALVAWGSMVTSAETAADRLAEIGIKATVLNARFALPLDTETILEVARNVRSIVLLDDSDSSGGFAMWVLEDLLRNGITCPTTIVSRHDPSYPTVPHEPHDACASEIVQRCRWLAEPVVTMEREVEGGALSIVRDAPSPLAWLEPLATIVPAAHDEHRLVLAQQLSPFIDHWVREYAKVGQRGVYLWRWCLHGLELTTLSCVAPQLRRDLCETKLLAVMYGVMLDDVADSGGDEDFLGELTKIISGVRPRDFDRFGAEQRQYAAFTVDLWEAFEQRLKSSPYFEEFEELLTYDHRQILNTMTYSSMVNRYPAMLNVQEHDMYLPHNMQMMSFATMDLMSSPNFDRRELGKLREIIWHAQSMGRIGNLVSTWQREIPDRDFTSGVFARAVLQGDLTLEDLQSAPSRTIEDAIHRGAHETYFLRQWEVHYKCIEALQRQIQSVDVAQLLIALQRLLHMELSSRGFK